MTAIPLVTVRAISADAKAPTEQLSIPAVLLAPLRADIVHFVHTNMAKNARQPYAVTPNQGHEHSAESWGTGRAVARVPRVSGGGNSRSGQAAFANMCRKGRMFGHTKTWRKWHRKINTNQKRFAVASALAATAEPALVLARGHRISAVPQIPLVIDNAAENITKTKQAVAVLQAVGAYEDVEKARESRKVRAGSGKARNRRHVMRRGPLVIYSKDGGITRALRNLPGVESAQVERINLLQLAPGGHLGRFVIFTKDAFSKLNSVFGSKTRESNQKAGYKLPQNIMNNADLTRIINSDEIQSKVRPAQRGTVKVARKKNPLTNLGALVKLNPFALQQRRSMLLTQARQVKAKAAKVAAARKAEKAHRSTKKANYKRLITDDHSGVVERADLARKAAKEEAKKKEEAAKKAAAESGKVGGKKKIKLIKEKRVKSAGGKGGKGGKGKVEAGKGKEAAKGPAAKGAAKADAKKPAPKK